MKHSTPYSRCVGLLWLLLLLAVGAEAQEVLAPLSGMPRLPQAKQGDTLRRELPFFDDFSNYEGLPDATRWLGRQAFVNKDYGPQAPTVGVATLDALDADGNLYAQASTNLFNADTLASQIIRLDSITGVAPHRLQPGDSLRLSFYYLPGGWYGNAWELVGDAPGTEDSLFLDFYDAEADHWDVVWATPGFDADTAGRPSRWSWRFASIKIDDPRYLTDRFQFRFRNYATLDANPKSGIAGNCDHWNLDYVLLDRNRTAADSFFRDVAFVEKAPSMLKYYQAMPARQYAVSDMATSLDIRIVNRYNQTLASSYSYHAYDGNGQQIGSYDGGYENIVPFFPAGQYQTMPVHCAPPVQFAYPATGSQATYRVVHVVREGVGGDNRTGNDTIVMEQHLGDYYAYDDGVAENGYGLTSTSSHQWLACRYDLRVADTLTAVDLCFNRTRNGENEDVQFQLCVWSCQNGKPSALLHKDATKQVPQFVGLNGLCRYALDNPVLVTDTIFVGFEQLSNDYINLGFDRSNDARPWTYYRTGNEWSQSILKGAVMMRPVFGSKALQRVEAPEPLQAAVYPNPVRDVLHIELGGQCAATLRMALYDIRGRRLMEGPYRERVDLSSLQGGIYLLRLTDSCDGRQRVFKIVVSD